MHTARQLEQHAAGQMGPHRLHGQGVGRPAVVSDGVGRPDGSRVDRPKHIEHRGAVQHEVAVCLCYQEDPAVCGEQGLRLHACRPAVSDVRAAKGALHACRGLPHHTCARLMPDVSVFPTASTAASALEGRCSALLKVAAAVLSALPSRALAAASNAARSHTLIPAMPPCRGGQAIASSHSAIPQLLRLGVGALQTWSGTADQALCC
jgi:hypothetical protein